MNKNEVKVMVSLFYLDGTKAAPYLAQGPKIIEWVDGLSDETLGGLYTPSSNRNQYLLVYTASDEETVEQIANNVVKLVVAEMQYPKYVSFSETGNVEDEETVCLNPVREGDIIMLTSPFLRANAQPPRKNFKFFVGENMRLTLMRGNRNEI